MNILIIDGEKIAYHINFLEMIKLFYLQNNKDNIYNYYILLLNIRLYSIYSQFETIEKIDKLRSLKDEIIQYFTKKVVEGKVVVEEKVDEVKVVVEGEKVDEVKVDEVKVDEKVEGVVEGVVDEKVEVKVVVEEKVEGDKEVEGKVEGVVEGEKKVEGEKLTIMIEEIQKQIKAEAETIKTDSHILPGFNEISKFDNSLTMFILLEILSNFVYNKADPFSVIFNEVDLFPYSNVFITYNTKFDITQDIYKLNTKSKYSLYYLYDQNKDYYNIFSMFLYKYYKFKNFPKVFIIPYTSHLLLKTNIDPTHIIDIKSIKGEDNKIEILQQIKHISSQLTSTELILDEKTKLNNIIEVILIIYKDINKDKDINKESIICALYSIIYSKNYNKIFIPTTTYPILIIDGSNLSYNIDLLKMIKQFIMNNTSALSELSKSSALIILNVRLYDKIMTLLTNARRKLSETQKKLQNAIKNSDKIYFTSKKITQKKEISELEKLYEPLYEPLKNEILDLKDKIIKENKSSLFNFANSINFESEILFDKRIYAHQITSILLQEILPLFLYSFLPKETIIHITMNCDSLEPRLDLKKNEYENFFVHDSSCEYITDNESDDFIAVFLYMLFLTNNKEVYLWTYDNYLWYKEQFPTIIQIEQIPNSFTLHYTTLKPYERKTPEHIIYRSPPP